MIRTVICFVLTLGACLNPVPTRGADALSEADKVAEHLLWAVGGRPAWARLTNTVLYSDQYRQSDGTAVGAVSTLDYDRSRLRIDLTGLHLEQVRIIDSEGDHSWRRNQDGRLAKVAEDPLARDLRRYTAHVYRTLQRIAVRDPKLRLATGRKGSLEVFEGGTRIAWYHLDARGEPYAMGAHDDDVGVICGPWQLEGRGIRYPLWVSRPDGSWRAMLKSLAVNTQVDEQLFALPRGAEQ
jgi:hypothetical protein